MTTAARVGYALRKPCAHCPFRTDVTPYLRGGRAREIADSIRQGGTFPCHQTTVVVEDEVTGEESRVRGSHSQECAGALIVQENEGHLGQVARIAERLGHYDRDRLDLDSPVFESFADFIRATGGQTIRTVEVDGDVLPYEHCGVVADDCEDPAGYGGYGGVHENEDDPTCNPVEDCCSRCGSTMCTACRADDDADGWKVCVNCAEDEDGD